MTSGGQWTFVNCDPNLSPVCGPEKVLYIVGQATPQLGRENNYFTDLDNGVNDTRMLDAQTSRCSCDPGLVVSAKAHSNPNWIV